MNTTLYGLSCVCYLQRISYGFYLIYFVLCMYYVTLLCKIVHQLQSGVTTGFKEVDVILLLSREKAF
jgi:hypothetical protein